MTTNEMMSTNDISQRTGASLRQLQWWDEQGWCQPQHVGHRRIYTPLLERRIKLLVFAAHIHGRYRPRATDLELSRRYLLLSGDRRRLLAASDSAEEIIRIARESYGVFLVDLGAPL